MLQHPRIQMPSINFPSCCRLQIPCGILDPFAKKPVYSSSSVNIWLLNSTSVCARLSYFMSVCLRIFLTVVGPYFFHASSVSTSGLVLSNSLSSVLLRNNDSGSFAIAARYCIHISRSFFLWAISSRIFSLSFLFWSNEPYFYFNWFFLFGDPYILFVVFCSTNFVGKDDCFKLEDVVCL